MLGSERSDGCCTGVHAHEMHVDIAVALEGRENAKGCVGTSAEGIDEHVDLAVLILINDIVHLVCVEVITSD